MGVQYTPEQIKKLGLVEKDGSGVFVPAKSLVAKKVDKIEIDFTNTTATPYFDGKRIKNQLAQLELNDINLPKETPEDVLNRFKKTGLFFKEIICGDTYTLPTGEILEIKHRLEITPCPAPRMTRSDQWKTDPNHENPLKRQRPPVTRYFKWQRDFMRLANQSGYTLQETLRVLFIMPMPRHLSKKKREMKLGQPHKQRPDTDNMMKSIKDVFKTDDGFVWDERGIKIWGHTGQIIIL